MRRVRRYKGWLICINNASEVRDLGFNISVIHPDNVGRVGLTARDTDWECNTIQEAIDWIDNYGPSETDVVYDYDYENEDEFGDLLS